MLNENMKRLRKTKGLSQEELAIKLNVVRQTVSKWENGLSVPDADLLIALANVLEVPVSTLLGETIAESPAPEDAIQVISEKLEAINLQLAGKSMMRIKMIRGTLIGLCVLIAVVWIALAMINGAYLDWNYQNPELAAAGAILHGFEFIFVRLSPIVFLSAIAGIIITWKRG